MRAAPVALTPTDQARARKHATGLSNRLTDRAFGLPGRDSVLAIIGLQNAGKLPDCGMPAREQGRVMAWPAAGYGVLAAGGLRGEEDEQA